MTKLSEILDFIEDPTAFEISYDGHTVAFQDEYGLSCGSNGEWFVAGQEFGPTVLIHARSFESAWEAWIDESPTIPESEVPEAYGVDDSEEMITWREAHPITTYCGPEYDTWSAAWLVEAERILGAWVDKARNEERDYPELIEGYEMQSNFSGTGIVYVGDHSWVHEACLDLVEISRKEETK
jgi:hypothetical protein